MKKLLASDAELNDQFGYSVAVSGDIAFVGALLEDAGGSFAGAAYVFGRDEGGPDNWGEEKKLTASDAEAGDFFGISVAVSGSTAIVGACCEDAAGSNAGAAYVFEDPAPPPPGPPLAVGGIAGLLDAGDGVEAVAGSGGERSARYVAALVGVAGAVFIAGGWYARRRWLR